MAKKAFRNTFIFTLIIINLIIWPSLFMEMKKDSGQASVDEETTDQAVESDTETAETGATESTSDNAEETNHSSNDKPSNEKTFKILKIE